MAYTQADLDAINAAIATGVLTVEYAGKRTVFRSLAEMRSIQQEIAREVSPATAAPATTVGVYSSGLQTGVIDPRGWRRGGGC